MAVNVVRVSKKNAMLHPQTKLLDHSAKTSLCSDALKGPQGNRLW